MNRIFRSVKTQAWLEAIITAFVLFLIVDWTVRNADPKIKPFIPVATIIALGTEILRIVDFTTKDLKEENEKLKNEKNDLDKRIDSLVSGSKHIKDFLEQVGKNDPKIQNSSYYTEIIERINNYLDDAKKLDQHILANQEANRWLGKKSKQKELAKAAANNVPETLLRRPSTANKSEKHLRDIFEKDICNCLYFVSINIDKQIDLRKTNIKKSELVTFPEVTQAYVSAIEYIKKMDLPNRVSKNELSKDAAKEVEKYLGFLIHKLS
ncbi:hypothetical protein [Nostoc sp. NMS9]|uniref:hypothetical protein n=1 Tax=Nostoc sp. NMS9 TaxID=2815393 RepID=UPI0025F1E978|nr:hypothetical protein [Nostoc sp. NMS9]MBN3939042.1 hypothetical protein [Nostoc sp. NMS9]